jgi:glycosyltransferase involved in cell wall biosynthesis
MVPAEPMVSVVIRNRDEAVFLERVLLALSVQTGPPTEVILVDNASRDASVAIARQYGAKVIHLEKAEFTYGKALNLGLTAARGKICIILSAHSLPLGRGFVSSCLAAFEDPCVAAARCVYVGKSSDMVRWTAPETLDTAATLDEIVSKGPLGSGCAIRRDVWAGIPFDERTLSAEDKLWAMSVVDAGYKIISPCDAFYYYLKPISPTIALHYNYRDLRAIFHATGERVGAARVGTSDTVLRALWTIATGVPMSALAIINREWTRIRLRLMFPNRASRTGALNGRSS